MILGFWSLIHSRFMYIVFHQNEELRQSEILLLQFSCLFIFFYLCRAYWNKSLIVCPLSVCFCFFFFGVNCLKFYAGSSFEVDPSFLRDLTITDDVDNYVLPFCYSSINIKEISFDIVILKTSIIHADFTLDSKFCSQCNFRHFRSNYKRKFTAENADI